MKKILATLAVAIIVTSAGAFAQSVTAPKVGTAPAKHVAVSKETKKACHKEAGKDKAKYRACVKAAASK